MLVLDDSAKTLDYIKSMNLFNSQLQVFTSYFCNIDIYGKYANV